MWNLFKVNNKNCQSINTHCPGVSIVDFEQVNAGWFRAGWVLRSKKISHRHTRIYKNYKNLQEFTRIFIYKNFRLKEFPFQGPDMSQQKPAMDYTSSEAHLSPCQTSMIELFCENS